MGTRRDPTRRRSPPLGWDKVVAAGWLVGVAILAIMRLLPTMVPLWYALLSLIAFAAYAADKAQAATRRQRISEQALHLVSLLGGWPGALVAQRHFRHKTRKTRFQVLFLATVLLHVVVLSWYLS